MQPMTKTKLLKLVYLVEETSVRTYGLPFFNLPFSVWQFGPVNRDLFVELSSPIILADFISCDSKKDPTLIVPRVQFSDDEFSDNEVELLAFIVEKFQDYNSQKLVELTHRKHSLWHQTAKEAGVLEYFEDNLMSTTDIEIDFSQLVENDKPKKSLYLSQKNYLENSRLLKA